MSLCKSRLFSAMKGERRSPDSSVIQTLNFGQDSDGEGEVDSFFQDVSMESVGSSPKTPRRSTSSIRSADWDSGLGSPTPSSLRRISIAHRSPKSDALSPIPFNVEDSDEDQVPPLPTSIFTPPHKTFRKLRLHDTPQTPKSLLQRSQRRITRPRSSKSGCKKEFDRPEANVNPFTPGNNTRIGIKRPRNPSGR